jgi:glycosyltransferase involved in cell wall biosynthesis
VPELGIVIPTRGRRLGTLRRALRRLERQRGGAGRFEVVVALDGVAPGPDPIEALIAQRPYPARVVRGGRPGASAARNAGWQAVSAPIVLFLDDDVLATGGLVAAHLDAHAASPDSALGVAGHVRWSRWPPPTPFMRWLDDGIQFDFRGLAPEAEVGWWHFYTANGSVARTMLERVEGFDETRFPFGYEDLDLAARMADHGFRLRYVPAALAEHVHFQTLADWRVRVGRIAAAERRFCSRHPGARAYFRDLFAEALSRPPARGGGARLAWVVPRRAPWLGPRVWASFDLWHRQQLAPGFLAAWQQAGRVEDRL